MYKLLENICINNIIHIVWYNSEYVYFYKHICKNCKVHKPITVRPNGFGWFLVCYIYKGYFYFCVFQNLSSPTNLNRLMVPFFGGMEIVVSRENKSRRGILSNLNSSNFGYVKLSRFLLTKKSFENMPKMNLSNYLILYLFVV